MNRDRRRYRPAWGSTNDLDRKMGAGTLLPRREGKVVPVSVHIKDNGLCTDDEEEEGVCDNSTTAENHVDGVDQPLTADLDCAEQHLRVPCCGSRSSSSSSVSGALRGYDDSNFKTSVYELPPELYGSCTSLRPRSVSFDQPCRPTSVRGLASEALSAVVRSCRSDSADDSEVTTETLRPGRVSSPTVYVVSDTRQLVVFTVDRTVVSPASPVQPTLSHSDQTLNR